MLDKESALFLKRMFLNKNIESIQEPLVKRYSFVMDFGELSVQYELSLN